MAIVILKGNCIYAQKWVQTLSHEEVAKVATLKIYNGYAYISMVQSDFTAMTAKLYKKVSAHITGTTTFIAGVYIDPIGGIYRAKMNTCNILDEKGVVTGNIELTPGIELFEQPIGKNEYNVITTFPCYRDAAMAFLEMGIGPAETINKVQMMFGFPENPVLKFETEKILGLMRERLDSDTSPDFILKEIEQIRKNNENLDNPNSKVEADKGN